MPVTVTAKAGDRALTSPLRTLVGIALAGESAVPGEIAIVLASDAELRDLNRRWRRIDRATDVLSFPLESPEPGPGIGLLRIGRGAARGAKGSGPVRAARRRISGDLAISLDRMEDQAKRYRVTRGRELARLVIHGTLHLAGLDHHKAAERRHMRAREEAAMRKAAAAIRRLDSALRRPGSSA